MLTPSERDRIYQTALQQLDRPLSEATRNVRFNVAIGRVDAGAKEAARAMFTLAAARLDQGQPAQDAA